MGKIQKVFITHTHGTVLFAKSHAHALALIGCVSIQFSGDHIFGILPLLASRLNGSGGMVDDADDVRLEAPLQAQEVR